MAQYLRFKLFHAGLKYFECSKSVGICSIGMTGLDEFTSDTTRGVL